MSLRGKKNLAMTYCFLKGKMYYGYIEDAWVTPFTGDYEIPDFSDVIYPSGNPTEEMPVDFESYLNQQGFPESYKPFLRELHAMYPNWVFEAHHTGLDWNTVIAEESIAGKNLLPNTTTIQTINGVTFTVNADGTVVANGTATANAVFRITCNLSVGETYTMSGCPAGGSTSTYFMQIGNFGNDTGSGVTAAATENTGSSVALLVMSGYTASNIVFKPQLEFGDVSTSYAPYSNIRPITGYDKLDLNHAGKNLMPVLSASDSNRDGIEWKNNKDGSWTANGTATAASYIAGGGMAFYLGVLPAGEYKLSIIASSEETGKLYLRIGSGADSTYLTSNDAQSKDKECTFVADGVTDYYAAIAIKSGETVKDYRIVPVLADSSNSVWSINFGHTVYGGKMDWLTGKLVAEWKFITLKADNITRSHSNYQKTCDIFVAGYSAIKTDNGHVGEVISSHCKAVTANEQYVDNNNRVAVNDKGYIVVTFKDILTEENAKTYITEQANAGTPVQIAHKLATPIEIQLTPSEIIALTGVNTLYGDGDTITAKFRQSKDVDILKRLSALETLMTNQTKGE